MQREILFRAKSLGNRGWVYGFYYNVYEKSKGKLHLNHYIISGQVAGKESSVFAVNGDTVSQYVGLKDKNGVKIFENDKTNMGVVLFENGCFGVKYEFNDFIPFELINLDMLYLLN